MLSSQVVDEGRSSGKQKSKTNRSKGSERELRNLDINMSFEKSKLKGKSVSILRRLSRGMLGGQGTHINKGVSSLLYANLTRIFWFYKNKKE